MKLVIILKFLERQGILKLSISRLTNNHSKIDNSLPWCYFAIVSNIHCKIDNSDSGVTSLKYLIFTVKWLILTVVLSLKYWDT